MINIGKNEIITVVGAGGKTSFINYFANYYRNQLKVLLTTTTNIYVLDKESYENIFMIDYNSNVVSSNPYGVTVCGKNINKKNKIVGLDFNDIDKIYSEFDLILIEGDGSKCKKIKGWNDTEPVVYGKTTKTVGIMDITSYDMDINEENIHRLDKFTDITLKSNGKIDIVDFKNIVLNKNGIFKNAIGEKILFINKVESLEYEEVVKKLIDLLNKENHDIKIFYGSIKYDFYKIS